MIDNRIQIRKEQAAGIYTTENNSLFTGKDLKTAGNL